MAAQALSTWPGNGSRAPCPVDSAFAHRFLPAVYLTVIPLGLLGNGLGLWHLCTGRREGARQPLSLLVANLGLADLLYVSTLPFLVSYYRQGRVWLFRQAWCRLTRSLFHLNLYASIGFLTCISIHRYLGIVHPLRARGRCSGAASSAWLSVAVWVWVIAQIAPDLAFSKTDDTGTKCHDTTGHEYLGVYLPYTFAVTVTGFVIPFLIIIGCYCHVVLVLCRNDSVEPSLRRRSIGLVILVMVLFSICFLPYHIFRNLNLFFRWQPQGTCTQASKDVYISYQVTRGLASLNSALNPLLYVVTSKDWRSRVRTLRLRATQCLRPPLRRQSSCQAAEKRRGKLPMSPEVPDIPTPATSACAWPLPGGSPPPCHLLCRDGDSSATGSVHTRDRQDCQHQRDNWDQSSEAELLSPTVLPAARLEMERDDHVCSSPQCFPPGSHAAV